MDININQRKAILITGASGFVGSAVVKQVIQDGNLPILLKRSSSNLKRLENINGYLSFDRERLKDQNLIDQIKEHNPKILINLAWRGVSGRDRNEVYQVEDNLPLTLETVEFAKEVGCERWIGVGSQAEYGNSNCQVDELFPTVPTTIYGKAKLAACWASLGLCQAYDICGSWVRLFDPYGPEDEPYWLIPYLIREMTLGNAPKLTKCEQLWDYLYVDDAAKGLISLAYSQASGIFNLGSGTGIPLRRVVEIIRNSIDPTISPAFGAVEYRPDQVMQLQANITKLSQTTGWKPQISIEKGLSNTIDWMMKNYIST
jgi:UDP-glucose 4-epimerase